MYALPIAAEFAAAHAWYQATFGTAVEQGRPELLPIALRCGDLDRDAFLNGCEVRQEPEGALVVASPQGIEIRCEVTVWEDQPVVEWVLHIRNTGAEDSPILADILPLDAGLSCAAEAACVLHHAKGSDCKLDDFAPLQTPLGETTLSPALGRSSNGTLPFFSLDLGGQGVIGAVGWTGGWAATFRREETGVHLSAGMQRTHLRLRPGEEIRTPRIALLFWQGDRVRAQNLWRRFILAHHTPRPNGALLQAPVSYAVWGENRVEHQIEKAEWMRKHEVPLDCFWIDAGWHGDAPYKEDSTVFNSSWGANVGNWWPNATTYPEGLKPVGDALRRMAYGFVLWFEPERVFRGTYFMREHPEWLLGPIGDNWLFSLGLPEARQALTELLSGTIGEGGITVYRQDFNMDPAPFWEAADAPDRVGMAEIRHIEGLYAMWDELLERHPGLVIDNCSSGGRRIDLETISRSIPLWRSDFQCWPDFDPIAIQGQTQGLAPWVPLSTGCFDRPDVYAARSALGVGVVIGTNRFEQRIDDYFPPDWLRDAVREQLDVRPFFYGDFYALTEYSLAPDQWAAWQWDRPDLGAGIVLALRRPASPYSRLQAVLQGLDAEAVYEFTNVDSGETLRGPGREWLAGRLHLEITSRPGSALRTYRRVADG